MADRAEATQDRDRDQRFVWLWIAAALVVAGALLLVVGWLWLRSAGNVSFLGYHQIQSRPTAIVGVKTGDAYASESASLFVTWNEGWFVGQLGSMELFDRTTLPSKPDMVYHLSIDGGIVRLHGVPGTIQGAFSRDGTWVQPTSDPNQTLRVRVVDDERVQTEEVMARVPGEARLGSAWPGAGMRGLLTTLFSDGASDQLTYDWYFLPAEGGVSHVETRADALIGRTSPVDVWWLEGDWDGPSPHAVHVRLLDGQLPGVSPRFEEVRRYPLGGEWDLLGLVDGEPVFLADQRIIDSSGGVLRDLTGWLYPGGEHGIADDRGFVFTWHDRLLVGRWDNTALLERSLTAMGADSPYFVVLADAASERHYVVFPAKRSDAGEAILVFERDSAVETAVTRVPLDGDVIRVPLP